MTITPDLLNLTKEQTFSSVAKGTVHLPIALDNDYPAGGYPIDSLTLFGGDGFTFRLIEGYAKTAVGTSYLAVRHDVAAGKLVVCQSNCVEMPDHTDLSTYTAYCTFHRW